MILSFFILQKSWLFYISPSCWKCLENLHFSGVVIGEGREDVSWQQRKTQTPVKIFDHNPNHKVAVDRNFTILHKNQWFHLYFLVHFLPFEKISDCGFSRIRPQSHTGIWKTPFISRQNVTRGGVFMGFAVLGLFLVYRIVPSPQKVSRSSKNSYRNLRMCTFTS